MKRHRTYRLVALTGPTLFLASLVWGFRADDWATYDRRSFRVAGVPEANALLIETTNGKREPVTLCGIAAVDSAKPWLADHAMGREVTLMLESPQTRDSTGRLRAFVFVDNQDLNVELVKAGLAYADRREKTVMDGLIDPAEADARKKKRGMWNAITYEQMPAWRKAWLKQPKSPK